MPQALRALFDRIRCTSDPFTRAHLCTQAALLRNAWIEGAQVDDFQHRLARGTAIKKIAKIFPIKRLILSVSSGPREGVKSLDRREWISELTLEYNRRWGADSMHRQTLVSDLIGSIKGTHEDFTFTQVSKAMSNVKLKNKLDNDGLCIRALRLIFLRQPHLVIDALNQLTSSDDLLRDQLIIGQIKGKGSHTVTAKSTRAILPLPCMLELADYIVASKINDILDSQFGDIKGVYVGAQRRTQVAELTKGLTLCVEKGLDSQGQIGIADADVQQFYDSVDMIIVFRWWLNRSLPPHVIATALRILVLPKVLLKCCGATVTPGRRTVGLFTGSRTAAAIGRIPILDVFLQKQAELRTNGFVTPSSTLFATSWVDNITTVSTSGVKAILNMTILEKYLDRKWRLTLKPDSKRYTSARPLDRVTSEEWQFCEVLPILGHNVSNNGCPRRAWRLVQAGAWRIFYAKLLTDRIKSLSAWTVVSLMDVHILPLLRFCWPNWPFSVTIASEIDAMQNRMLGMSMRIAPWTDEDIPTYFKRRAKMASWFTNSQGKWSCRWAEGTISFDKHCQRNHNGKCWRNALAEMWTADLLAAERARFAARFNIHAKSWTSMSGRTATRHAAGHVTTRMHDALVTAHSHVQNHASEMAIRRARRG